ncbi:MAG: primase, partial [Clostridiales bacterium]|nr:primase [Clostridiales bacterium]
VSEYVKLDRKGKYLFGLCPFHKEKSPSFSVTPSMQIFHCYGCGKGGNVFSFIMQSENLQFIEAVKFLADRAKIQLPEGEGDEEKEKARIKQEILNINIEAARFYRQQLLLSQNEKANNYLNARGINQQTVKKFGLGFSTEEWDALYKHLSSKGFNDDLLFNSGLVLKKKNGGYYDRFRARIMFPIFDIRGNVIGFGGRVLDSSVPKYLNSPETLVYNKGKNLYGMNFAKSSSEKQVIIVEGYMDVISLHQRGIINTVASLGTALTESQGRLLKKYAEEIIISYDADTAGQAATMRGLDLLNDIGCNVKVLIVPEGKDPDEFIKKNGEVEFKKLITSSISLLEYKVKILRSQVSTDTTEGKIKFLNKLADVLTKIDNRVEREMYIKKLAKDYEISEESLLSEIYRRVQPKKNYRATAPFTNDSSGKAIRGSAMDSQESKLIHFERMLIAFLCVDNSIFKMVKDKISVNDFVNDEDRKAADIIFNRLSDNRGIVPGEMLTLFDTVTADELAKIIQEECNCEDNTKAVLDIIKRIELLKTEKRQQQILDLLNNRSEFTEGDVETLKQELNSILMKKKKT